MHTSSDANSITSKLNTYLSMRTVQAIMLGLIVLFGVLLTLHVTNYAKEQARESFQTQAIALAAGISPEDVIQLTGNPTDINLPAYKHTILRMRAAKLALKNARFVYMMKKIDQKIIFISDSEPSASKDFSSYGEAYTESSPAFRKIFETGAPLMEGPISDRWGIWISVHAPIKDDTTGKVLAVVGIDIDARSWQHQMRIYQISALMLTLLLLILFTLSVFYFMAMTHWRHAEEIIRQKANEDHLTGLPNRMFLQTSIQQTIHRCKRNRRKFAILFLDVNGLKMVNDELGHAAGDALICEVAARLKQLLRASDAVGRLGGDEFVVVIEEIHNLKDALNVAEKIRTKIAEPLALEELGGLVVSCSIGIALYPENGETLDSLLLHADADMYAKKKQTQDELENSEISVVDSTIV